jgi:hypothetical protein
MVVALINILCWIQMICKSFEWFTTKTMGFACGLTSAGLGGMPQIVKTAFMCGGGLHSSR